MFWNWKGKLFYLSKSSKEPWTFCDRHLDIVHWKIKRDRSKKCSITAEHLVSLKIFYWNPFYVLFEQVATTLDDDFITIPSTFKNMSHLITAEIREAYVMASVAIPSSQNWEFSDTLLEPYGWQSFIGAAQLLSSHVKSDWKPEYWHFPQVMRHFSTVWGTA